MSLTTADIGIQLLMDSTVSLQEIEARLTARVFAAMHQPERGPAVLAVLEQLLAVLDAPTPGRWADPFRLEPPFAAAWPRPWQPPLPPDPGPAGTAAPPLPRSVSSCAGWWLPSCWPTARLRAITTSQILALSASPRSPGSRFFRC